MAEFIGFQPNDFFNTKLYTGNNSTNAITGVGFEPALTWLKYRNGTSTQTVQASTLGDYYLSTNGLDGKTAAPNWDSFDADGFTVSVIIMQVETPMFHGIGKQEQLQELQVVQ